MITSVNHRISKNGKPFGSFTIEDYDEAFEMVLFGEDYLKYKIWLNPGEFVHIRGKLQERFNQQGNIEFKISSIQLLSDLRDKMLKSITLRVPVTKVSGDWIREVISVIKSAEVTGAPANCTVKVRIYDPADSSLNVDLPSKKYKISPQNEVIESLSRLAELEF
jgi:DNA polymerase-3 subunit alpha